MAAPRRRRPRDDDGPSRPMSSEYFGGVRTERLGARFYDRPCEELAKSLLGKVLVRRVPSDRIGGDDDAGPRVVRGRIVETECYAGPMDAASHSYGGRVTARNEPMYMRPGTAYVYMTYGMYYCFNISSAGDGAAVLLRSLEPLDDLDTMERLRKQFRKCAKTDMKKTQLCNGPAKLCMSFAIDIESCNKQDLSTWDGMWVEEDKNSRLVDSIVCSPRIGIKCEKEWQDKFLRFYILDNVYVSKLEKTKMSVIKYSHSEN